jgi:hypothetical protein
LKISKGENRRKKSEDCPKYISPEEAKWIIGTLSGYCEMFRGTGILDPDECKRRVWETYGVYLRGAQEIEGKNASLTHKRATAVALME